MQQLTKSIVVVLLLSCVPLSVTPWTVACLAPPSIGFPRQEYWTRHSLLQRVTKFQGSLFTAHLADFY